MPISRHAAQPRTAGPSSSTMRWTSGSLQASSQPAAPTRSTASGSLAPDATAARAVRWVTSASTCSKTAAKSSRLSANWW